MSSTRFFHMHLASDATGETLVALGRAAASQYGGVQAVEHLHVLVRSAEAVDRAAREIAATPGIVLYTMVDEELSRQLRGRCEALGVPCVDIMAPLLGAFQTYLGERARGEAGAQHALNASYFKRIDALDYTMEHDDGQLGGRLSEADVILFGVSRTSKTPTALYLANRGLKTANVPFLPGDGAPTALEDLDGPLIVGLIASPDRVVQVRQHRLLGLDPTTAEDSYVDRAAVAAELAECRRICAAHRWPVIDVSRRSIEETAAAILDLLAHRETA